jgi:hypothetical protein
LVTDDIGDLMTITWLGRFAPARLAQVLEFRDGTSVFPTSTVPARCCDTDHSDPGRPRRPRPTPGRSTAEPTTSRPRT